MAVHDCCCCCTSFAYSKHINKFAFTELWRLIMFICVHTCVGFIYLLSVCSAKGLDFINGFNHGSIDLWDDMLIALIMLLLWDLPCTYGLNPFFTCISDCSSEIWLLLSQRAFWRLFNIQWGFKSLRQLVKMVAF